MSAGTPGTGRWLLPLAAALVALVLLPLPAAAVVLPGAPAGYQFCHSYAEVNTAIDDTVAAHPT
jgi:hypothetical protein